MERMKDLLDAHLAALISAEPYFAPNFTAARRLLDGAKACNGGLRWSTGAVCGPQGCSCSDRGCLHRLSWLVFVGVR